jgi:ABC-2 type transport system ATP-binding protein
MSAALETAGLGRRYHSRWGLRDCTLDIAEGTITGLVGPNGAGKSTLLRLTAGISRPTTGTVAVFGEEIKPNGTDHLRRIGYLDQLRPLYAGFRVRDVLTLGRRLNRTWDDAAARQWLDDLDIALTDKVGTLSLGQQAQVALTLCMGKRPDLLLLDEPLASLDPLARRQLLQTLLSAVAERGTTVLLSSHIVSELEPVCDHLVILSASRLQVSGPIEALVGEHAVLVGPRHGRTPPGLDVISATDTGRQSTRLVRGSTAGVDPAWQVLQAGLEEIVLAYLGRPETPRPDPGPYDPRTMEPLA